LCEPNGLKMGKMIRSQNFFMVLLLLATKTYILQVCEISITSQIMDTWYSSLSTNILFVPLVGWDQMTLTLLTNHAKILLEVKENYVNKIIDHISIFFLCSIVNISYVFDVIVVLWFTNNLTIMGVSKIKWTTWLPCQN